MNASNSGVSRCGMVLFLVVLCGLAFPCAAFAQSFVVKKGQAHAEIVIADKPARMAKLAARELQTYIEKITGAKLPITSVPNKDVPVKIYVGKSAHTDRLKLSTDGLAHGAFRMASGKDWLALVGPDTEFKPVEPYAHRSTRGSRGRGERVRIDQEWDKITGEKYSNPFHYVQAFWREELQVWQFDDAGTLNAVYDFLRGLGVRWYYPGELGEIVPKAGSIALPEVSKVVQPDFALRKLGWWSQDVSMTLDEHLWTLRMGANQGAELIGLTQPCHGSKFVHMRSEFKKANPKCFALYNGERALDHKGVGAPCLSSDEFFKHNLRYARAVFDHYNEPVISIDVVDGYGRGVCQCDLCKGKDTPERGWEGLMSDYVFGYVDRVAKELNKSHPKKRVSALAYGAYALPPEKIGQFPPNLAVWICQARKSYGDHATFENALKLRKDWLAKLPSKQFYIYDYYMEGRPGGPWEGVPVYIPRLISKDLRSLKGVGGLGEYIDLYQPHDRSKLKYDYLAVTHLNLYVTTRLWWDADRDVAALLEDYYVKFYGPARKEMKAFIEYSEANWPRMRTDVEAIDKALELAAAARRAAGDGIYGKRVDLAVTFIEPLKRLKAQLAKARKDVPIARALKRNKADIKLDGKLDDKFWEGVRTYALRELQTGTPAASPTSFKIAWAGDGLYLGIRCADRDMAGLNIGATKKDDPDVWSGDAVEVLIETPFHSYYQIAISPTGAVTDLDREKGFNTRWSSGAEVATQRNANSWTIEVRLPAAGENAKDIDALSGIAGKRPSTTYSWYINVCRQRVRGEDTELSAWSPTRTNRFNVPEKFGKVWVR